MSGNTRELTPSSSLALSSTLIGDNIVFTLDDFYWSRISGLREGFIIKPTTGTGSATVSMGPVYQSYHIECEITENFSNSSYGVGSWYLQAPDYVDLTEYLPDYLQVTKLLPTYLDTFKKVFSDETADAIQRFLDMKRWDRIEVDYIKNLKETLGFFADISEDEFDEDEHRRLLRELLFFYTISGTDKFIDFLAYIKSADFEYEPLWTDDYINFVTSKSTPNHYLTSRINLVYDVLVYPNLFDTQGLVQLFYKIAPVNTVVHNFLGLVKARGGFVFTGLANPSPTSEISSYVYDDSLTRRIVESTLVISSYVMDDIKKVGYASEDELSLTKVDHTLQFKSKTGTLISNNNKYVTSIADEILSSLEAPLGLYAFSGIHQKSINSYQEYNGLYPTYEGSSSVVFIGLPVHYTSQYYASTAVSL